MLRWLRAAEMATWQDADASTLRALNHVSPLTKTNRPNPTTMKTTEQNPDTDISPPCHCFGLVLAATTSPKVRRKLRSPKPIKSQRGEYLVRFGDCNACHTPLKMGPKGPEPEWSRMLSGHPEDTKLPPPPKLDSSPWFAATAGMTAWAGPWGISYAVNLTPDTNTGLGIWTEDMFLKADAHRQTHGSRSRNSSADALAQHRRP